MTFRQAVKEASKVLISARGKSFKTTKKEIWKAVAESDWDRVLDEPRDMHEDEPSTPSVKIYSHRFHYNGVHLRVFCWDEGTVVVVNLTPSY